MEVIQIVGYKNSGKTTTAKRLIEVFSKSGIRVASLKHHGHGGIPQGMEDTDSAKHLQAGSVVAGVEGEGVLQLRTQEHWQMDQMIAIYQIMNLEVLVIEGFKQESYKKIVVINKEEDLILLSQVTNILAVITSFPIKEVSSSYTIFNRTDLNKLCNWIVENYKSKIKSIN